MSKEKRFTEEIQCRRCKNSVRMEVLRDGNDIDSAEGEEAHGGLTIAYSWDVGDLFQLAKCPACHGITIRRAGYHSGYMTPGDVEFETIYPEADGPEAPRGLPEKVRRAFDSATKVRNIDANTYGMALGRVLELVCQDRQAQGKFLNDKLHDLAKKGEIPGQVADIADRLRKLRNIGAHADLGELTEADLPVLDNLTRAILEYVYTAPALVEDAENCLKRLGHEG